MWKRISLRQSWLAVLLVLGLIVGFGGAAPNRVAAQNATPAASLRFVNAIAGGGPIDVMLDNTPIAQGLAFGKATEYASVPPGDHGLRVFEAGKDQGQPLIDQKATVEGGAAYNFIVASQNNQFQAQLLQVNLDAVGVGQARYQIVQASPDLGDTSVVLGDTNGNNANSSSGNNDTGNTATTVSTNNDNAAGNGGFLGGGGYQDVAAGTYTLHLVNGDNSELAIQSPSVTLASGKVYDLLIVGQNADQSLSVLPLVTDVFAPCGTQLKVGKPTDACARFIHVSPDAGQVDILIDGTPAAQAISYGTATEFTPLASGDHQIQVVPTGGAAGSAMLDETVTFDAGQAYQFSVTGLANGDGDTKLALHQDQIDLTPLPAGQARLRVINTVVNGGDATTTAAGNNLLDTAAYGKATQYALVNAGSLDLSFQIERGNDQAPLTVDAKGTQLKEGSVYDVFLIGNASDQSTVQALVLTTQATVRQGAQGTPVTIVSPGPQTQASPVSAASATVVGGSPVGSPVGTAPVSTVVATATPTPVS